jgi:hypothetical protein
MTTGVSRGKTQFVFHNLFIEYFHFTCLHFSYIIKEQKIHKFSKITQIIVLGSSMFK